MKRLILVLALVLMAMPLCVMAEGEWTVPQAGEVVTMERDLGVLVDGVYYPVFQPVDALMAALGDPEETIVSPSCVFEGEDCEFDYAFGSLFTSPIDGVNVWYELYIFDVGMTTTRGLAVGDSVERMLELYGDGYYCEGEGMYTYSLSGDPDDYASPCLIFETADGAILTIDIYYPTNI